MDESLLMTAVREAKHHVESGPDGHLPLAMRQQLWEAMGPYRAKGTPLDVIPVPQRRRATLFIASAQRAMPAYSPDLTERPLVDRALLAAQQRLTGAATWEACRAVVYDLESLIQTLPEHGETALRSMYVAQAVSSALSVAMGDCQSLGRHGLTDDDLDRWDSGMYASWVLAGGAPWDATTPTATEQRRRFWCWYVETAAISAYQAYAWPS